jgi:serine/threonine protein kinase/Tfp pilus assembly protein PilF
VAGDDPRVIRALEEYLAAQEAGRKVDRAEFLARYPEVAGALANCLDALEFVRVAAPQLQASEGNRPEGPVDAVADIGTPLGDFRILREIGRGGMGVVYEAEQLSLGRRVALKVLPFAAALDAKQLQRFKNEAHAAAHLQHQNIVPVYAVGCERGVHFYAMQFVEGQTLAALIQELRQVKQDEDRRSKIEDGELQKRATHSDPGRTGPYAPENRVARPESSKGVTSDIAHPLPSLPPLVGEGTGGGDSGRATPENATVNDQGDGNETARVTPRSSILHPRSSFFRTVANLGIQAAEALEHAHQLGVIHRDIKPANLMVDARGNLWITDFGLAHCQGGCELTMSGDLLGTLRYMSPEQALAKRVIVDERTDIYSLGATLYELLTLEPAFPGTDRQEVLRQIAFEEPKPPRRLNKQIPAELETIVLKAMEKNAAERYATAQELADDLRRLLEDQPIRARRPTLLARLARWGRRHRPLVAGAAAALLMGLIVLAGSFGWVASDQAARRKQSTQVINAALKEADSWQKQRRLPEALSAARRADGLLAGAEVDEALRQYVWARLADLELVDVLESVRLDKETAIKDGHFDEAAAHAEFGRIFRAAGLDIETLPPEEAGERIALCTVAVELAAVLDYWAMSCHAVRGEDDPMWKRLLRVARVADPDPFRIAVRDALEKQDFLAVREFAAAEETMRLQPMTLAVLGSALLRDDEARGPAEVFLREALRRHPDDFWLNYNLFKFYSAFQPPQWDEAIRFAQSAVALRPGSPGAHGNLGYALYRKGRLDEALAEYRETIRLAPEDTGAHITMSVILHAKRLVDQAIAECLKALDIDKNSALAHYNLGVNLADKGLMEEAIAHYREANRLDNDIAESHYNLGNALRDKGQLEEAAAEFLQAIRVKKDKADAHCNLGVVWYRLRKLPEAVVAYREAIKFKPDLAEAWSNLGQALRDQKNLTEAVLAFRKAIELKPDYANAFYNLGKALFDQKKLAEAEAAFRKAIQFKPESVGAYYNLGVALYYQDKLAEAVDAFRKAVEINHDDALAYSSLGNALRRQKKLAQAETACRKAIELDSKLPDAHYNLGIVLQEQNRLQAAVAAYREAIRLKSEYPEAYCNLGHVLKDLGQFADALAALKRRDEMGTKNPGWRYPSADWVRQAEHLVELDARLPQLLKGELKPANAAESLGIAVLCQQYKTLFVGATHFYQEAFLAQPGLADDLLAQPRYKAARAAALAGCGQGKDADKADSKERASLRKQALDWLRADLRAYRQMMDKSADKAGPEITQRLQYWLQDTDFTGVRGQEALAKLPEAERGDWQKLWEEVEALRQRTANPAPPAGAARS